MTRLIKTALFAVALMGLQATANGASAAEHGLSHYAQDPSAASQVTLKPIIVADRRKRGRRPHRKKRDNIGGKIAAGIAVGVAGLILSEAIRDARRERGDTRTYYYYDDDRRDYSYPGRRQCRRWARRCDNGVRRACRKWYRRCE